MSFMASSPTFFGISCQVSAVRGDVYNEGDIQERENAN
jgi:hypothetical protein